MTDNNQERDYVSEFYQFAGNDPYEKLSQRIDEIPEKDVAYEYRHIMLNEYLTLLVGTTDTYKPDYKLEENAREFLLENTSKDKPSDHKFIKAYLAYDAHDYEKCLSLLDEVFSP
ncbi:MAG: hypothetical protein IJJ44_04045 [Solobacterium sp.]|nr:hypothetical protein [Solobacterium sp.]